MIRNSLENCALSFEQLRRYLIQRFPIIMVDRVLDYEIGKRLRALKNISGNEIFFLGHFPSLAIMPGAVIVEGIGQCVAILFQLTLGRLEPDELPIFGAVKARFLKPVFPGDQVIYQVNAIKFTSSSGIFTGEASVDGTQVVRAELSVAKRSLSELLR